MAAPRSRLLADLKKAFAVSHGLDERTARRHYNTNSEKWQAYVAKQGIEAAKNLTASRPSAPAGAAALQMLSPASPAEMAPPGVESVPDDQLSAPARIMKQQWLIYTQASKAWRDAIVGGDEMKSLAFGQATIKAQDAYYKAKARHDQWELDERRKIPAGEFHAFRSAFILPLANFLRNLPAAVAHLVNPQNVPHAMRALDDYMITSGQPQIDRMISALDEQAPITC